MPQYMLTIIEDESRVFAADWAELLAAHQSFGQEVEKAGCKITSGEALHPVATATFLRGTRTPGVQAVDNPHPDAKEVLGGFYVVEAPDEQTARTVAELCPAPFGYVEMRPVMAFAQ